MEYVFNEGRGVRFILSLGHAFGGQPGNGIPCGIVVFEHCLKFGYKVEEGPHGDGSARDGTLSNGGGPDKGGPVDHVGEGEYNHLVISIIDFFIDKEVEADCIQPLQGFLVGSIKGFRGSNTEFGGFQRRHW